ncbi:MAG: GNAT family N-acetyltransferase [Shimia sp.]
MSIRAGRPGDGVALRAIHEASWRDAYAASVPPEAFGMPLARVMERRWCAWPNDRSIWVHEEAMPQGFVALVDRGGGHWLLDNLHVAPEWRGRGIGARLLRHALIEARAMDASEVELEVLAGNRGARRFYAAHGGVEGPGEDTDLLGYPAAYRTYRWDRAGLEAMGSN